MYYNSKKAVKEKLNSLFYTLKLNCESKMIMQKPYLYTLFFLQNYLSSKVTNKRYF